MFEQNLGKVMPVGRLGLLTLDSWKDLGKKVDEQLVKWRETRCHELNDHPATIDYVEQHYGLQIDHDRYDVFYEIFAENVMPEITVIEKN